MKKVFFLFLILAFVGCQATYQSKNGKLRHLSIARNVYQSNCGDCETLIVNAENYQSGALTKISDGFFGSLVQIVKGLIPRGIPSE